MKPNTTNTTKEAGLEITANNQASTIMRMAAKSKTEIQIESLFERGAMGMIVAPAKAKKTMLSINLALSLLTKKPFLGKVISSTPEKVLYANLELTAKAFGDRLNLMNNHYNAKNLDDLIIVSRSQLTDGQDFSDPKERIVTKSIFENLIQTILHYGITTVIIDPLYIVVGEENDNVMMTKVCTEFEQIRQKTGATVIIVHHTGKAKIDWEEPFLVGRGASSLAGAMEFVIGVEPKEENNKAIIHHGARNLTSCPPLTIYFDPETLVWDTAIGQSADQQLDDIMGKNDVLAVSIVKELSGLTSREITKVINRSKNYARINSHKGQVSKITRLASPKPTSV